MLSINFWTGGLAKCQDGTSLAKNDATGPCDLDTEANRSPLELKLVDTYQLLSAAMTSGYARIWRRVAQAASVPVSQPPREFEPISLLDAQQPILSPATIREAVILAAGQEVFVSGDLQSKINQLWEQAWQSHTDITKVLAWTPTAWESRQLIAELASRGGSLTRWGKRVGPPGICVLGCETDRALCCPADRARVLPLPRDAEEGRHTLDTLRAWVADPSVELSLVQVNMQQAQCCPPQFLADLQRLSEHHEVTLVADEIRAQETPAGAFFSFPDTALKPDFVLFGGPHVGLFGIAARPDDNRPFAGAKTFSFFHPTRSRGPLLDLVRSARILAGYPSIAADSPAAVTVEHAQTWVETKLQHYPVELHRADWARDYGLRLLPVEHNTFKEPAYIAALLDEAARPIAAQPSRHLQTWQEAWSQLAPQATLIATAATGSEANGLCWRIATAVGRLKNHGRQSTAVWPRLAWFDGAWGGSRGPAAEINSLWGLVSSHFVSPGELRLKAPTTIEQNPTDPDRVASLGSYEDAALNTLARLVDDVDEPIGAIHLEVIQGPRGVYFYRPSFLARLRQFADARQVPIIADEVLTVARTRYLLRLRGLSAAVRPGLCRFWERGAGGGDCPD